VIQSKITPTQVAQKVFHFSLHQGRLVWAGTGSPQVRRSASSGSLIPSSLFLSFSLYSVRVLVVLIRNKDALPLSLAWAGDPSRQGLISCSLFKVREPYLYRTDYSSIPAEISPFFCGFELPRFQIGAYFRGWDVRIRLVGRLGLSARAGSVDHSLLFLKFPLSRVESACYSWKETEIDAPLHPNLALESVVFFTVFVCLNLY
jgi:hypothetical protein